MRYPVKKLLPVLLLALIAPTSRAAILYLQYTGSFSATGTIDGVSFSSSDWTLEFGFDSATADSDTENGQVGNFTGAIVSGALRIGSTTYSLSGSSAGGNIRLYHVTGANTYGQIYTNPNSGGNIQIYTSAAAMVPSVFSDPNSLNTLVIGSSLSNATKDSNFTATSGLRFDYNSDSFYGYDHRLRTSSGEMIEFSGDTAAESGLMSIMISDASISAVPEPATSGLIFAAISCGAAVLRRRSRGRALETAKA